MENLIKAQLKKGVAEAMQTGEIPAGLKEMAAKAKFKLPAALKGAPEPAPDNTMLYIGGAIVVLAIIAYYMMGSGYYYEENYNEDIFDNLGPTFGTRSSSDSSRAILQEGYEAGLDGAPVGNRQLDESLPSAVSVLNDPRFHTVTKTLLSVSNRIGQNINVRNPTTDIRGAVPSFSSGPGTLYNNNLTRSRFSDQLG